MVDLFDGSPHGNVHRQGLGEGFKSRIAVKDFQSRIAVKGYEESDGICQTRLLKALTETRLQNG